MDLITTTLLAGLFGLAHLGITLIESQATQRLSSLLYICALIIVARLMWRNITNRAQRNTLRMITEGNIAATILSEAVDWQRDSRQESH